MANPQIIACPKNVWTKVAEGVSTGNISINKWPSYEDKIPHSRITYLATHRVTGDPPPSNDNYNEGDIIGNEGAIISDTLSIDVYIYCLGEDGSIKISI